MASCSLVCLRHRNSSSCPSRRQISPEINTRRCWFGNTSRKTFLPRAVFLDSTCSFFSLATGLFLGLPSSRSAALSQPSIKPAETAVRSNKPNRVGRVDVLIPFSLTSRRTVENQKANGGELVGSPPFVGRHSLRDSRGGQRGAASIRRVLVAAGPAGAGAAGVASVAGVAAGVAAAATA